MTDHSKSLIQIHIAVVMFGLSGLFGKFAGQPALIITFGRVFFASISMFALFKLKGTDIKLHSKGDFAALAMAGAVLALTWSSFFLSIQASTVAIAVLTFSAYPIFITFIEPVIFHERIKLRDIICAFVMFAGVMLIVPEFQIGNDTTIGVIWGMVSSLTFAVLSLINRKLVKTYPGRVVAFYEQSTAAVLMMPALFLIRPVLTPRSILLLVLLGVVFTAMAHSMFIGGMKNVRAQTAGMIASLESVYGIIAAALMLREIPSVKELIGGAIILGAALYSTVKSSK